MPEKLEKTDIAEIARHLDLRRNIDHPTVLFLGSRAGGLFRSLALAERVRSFSNLPVQKDPFATAYHFFNQLDWGADELRGLLRNSLRNVDISEADLSLAQLVKQKLFKVIISTNIDSLLERALDKVGMKRTFDFETVIPERDRERGFEPGPSELQLHCRIIKSFGDLSVRSSYQIAKSKKYLDDNEPLKEWLSAISKRDVLAVGLDVYWDQDIIRAILPSDNSLWFVHEESLLDHQLIQNMFQGRPVKYIAGPEGSYDTFFRALRQHLIPTQIPTTVPKELVNRITEVQIIDEAFTTLLDLDNVQKTPVLTFHGIGGIGKTAIIQYVTRRCENEHLPYIHIEAQDIPGLARAIQKQVNKYHNVDALLQDDDDSLERSKIATRELLKKNSAVILVDALATEEQMKWLGTLLKDIHRGNRLFVVLASKRKLAFEPDRSFTRQLRLWSLELGPLDRESCQEYLSQPDLQLEDDVREIVYNWTHGYPLAMQVMKEAIASGLDLSKDEDRLTILAMLIERVIIQNVLAGVTPEQRSWYQNILGLLSFPRRFSTETMGSLIEAFAPEFKRESKIAYMTIPRKINEATEVLSWDMARAGLAVNTSVRDLFLLDFRLRQPEQYRAIHAFLARLNYEQIQRNTGIERTRCLREYIYHLICQGDNGGVSAQLSRTFQAILQETPEELVDFFNEFTQDESLQETLSGQKDEIMPLIHKVQALIYQRFALATTDADRIQFLHSFFTHLIQIQEVSMLPQAFQERLTLVVQAPASESVLELYEELQRQELFLALFRLDALGQEPSKQNSYDISGTSELSGPDSQGNLGEQGPSEQRS